MVGICSVCVSCGPSRSWDYCMALQGFSQGCPLLDCRARSCLCLLICGRLLALLRMRDSRCLSAQVGQRVWPGLAGFGQLLHRPSSLAFRRLSWAMRRRYSLRSGLWLLVRSYSRRACTAFSLSCTFFSGARVAFRRGFGVMGCGAGFPGRLLGFFFVVGSGSILALVFFLFLSLPRFGSERSIVWTKSWLLKVRVPAPAGRTVRRG